MDCRLQITRTTAAPPTIALKKAEICKGKFMPGSWFKIDPFIWNDAIKMEFGSRYSPSPLCDSCGREIRLPLHGSFLDALWLQVGWQRAYHHLVWIKSKACSVQKATTVNSSTLRFEQSYSYVFNVEHSETKTVFRLTWTWCKKSFPVCTKVWDTRSPQISKSLFYHSHHPENRVVQAFFAITHIISPLGQSLLTSK